MKSAISNLLSALVLLLPVQSLLGVFAVNRLGLPVSVLLWKELLLIILIAMFSFEIYKKVKAYKVVTILRLLWVLLLIAASTIYILFNSMGRIPFSNIFYGFRFELFWVFFLSIFYTWFQLADLETLEYIKQRVSRCIYIGFVPVMFVSYLTILFGQDKILSFFGFGINSSKLLADIPISHVVDGGGWNNLLRLSGTFTTPNHFAGYLLLILGFFLYRSVIERSRIKKMVFSFATLNIVIFIGLSFARFAWLSLLAWVLVLGAYYLIKNKITQKIVYILAFILPILIGTVAINLPEEFLQKSVPSFIAKPSSTTFHARRTFATLEVLANHPKELWIGYGLGASGPAAKDQYTSVIENPLFKDNIQTALKYYLRPEEILIPENWFIQLVLNGGLIYAFLYSIVVLLPIGRLFKRLFGDSESVKTFDIYILLGLFSVVIGNLFLHLWENQTVAIFYVILVLFMYKPLTARSK
jgi:hypothetical protein